MYDKLILIILFALSSCMTMSSKHSMIGSYKSIGKDYVYDLELKPDSTFQLTQIYTEVKAGCSGEWKIISENLILLKCFPADLEEQLQSGYLSNRERRVLIINNRKLKLENVTLKSIRH